MRIRILVVAVIGAIAFLLTPFPAFAQQYATVTTATALNIRSGPGTQYLVEGTLSAGDRVEVVGSQTVEDDTWYSIVSAGNGTVHGWARGDYLRFEQGTRDAASAASDQTVLAFQTEHYAVRVYRQGGQLRMNVFDKPNGATFVNGAPARVAPPRSADDNWTSYAHQSEVEAYARINPNGDREFELVQVTGNRIVERATE